MCPIKTDTNLQNLQASFLCCFFISMLVYFQTYFPEGLFSSFTSLLVFYSIFEDSLPVIAKWLYSV